MMLLLSKTYADLVIFFEGLFRNVCHLLLRFTLPTRCFTVNIQSLKHVSA